METLPPLMAAAGSSVDGAGTAATRDIFDAALGQPLRAAVVPRDALAPGARLAGPAAIFEDETTVIVPTSRRATIQPDGCIDLSAEEEG